MDPRRLRLTAAALGDLEDIRRYTIERWGRAQWLGYFAGMESVFDRLRREPLAGRDMARLAPGLRSMIYRSHLAFFHTNGRGEIVVLRVLHQKRNADALRWVDAMSE